MGVVVVGPFTSSVLSGWLSSLALLPFGAPVICVSLSCHHSSANFLTREFYTSLVATVVSALMLLLLSAAAIAVTIILTKSAQSSTHR